MKEVQLTIKRGLLDSRPRELIINSEFIRFEDKDLRSDLYTQFDKSSITAYRFGIKWIRGIEFTIGREYQIFILGQQDKILKINFKSLYRIKRKEYHEKYAQIVNSLWSFYFFEISNNLFERFQNKEEFILCDVNFTKEHLTIKVTGVIREKKKEISWDKVGTRDYETYFTIFSLDDPANIYRGFSYLEDWNSDILNNLVKRILDSKK
jgi:hypothetical protein